MLSHSNRSLIQTQATPSPVYPSVLEMWVWKEIKKKERALVLNFQTWKWIQLRWDRSAFVLPCMHTHETTQQLVYRRSFRTSIHPARRTHVIKHLNTRTFMRAEGSCRFVCDARAQYVFAWPNAFCFSSNVMSNRSCPTTCVPQCEDMMMSYNCTNYTCAAMLH